MARNTKAKRKLSTTNAPLGGSIKRAKSGQEDQPLTSEPSSSKETESISDSIEAKEAGDEKLESKLEDPSQSEATFYLWADALSAWVDDSPEELVLRLKSEVLKAWATVEAASEDLSEDDKDDLVADAAGQVGQWYVDELGKEDGERGVPARKLAEIVEALLNEDVKKNTKDGDADEDEGADEDDKPDDGWWWELKLQRARPVEDTPAIEVNLFGGRIKEGEAGSYDGRWWWTSAKLADETGARALSSMVDYLVTGLQ